MDEMKSNSLLYIPSKDWFTHASCKQIDLNCHTSDQHYTKCLLNSVVLRYFKIGSLLL